MVQKTQESAHKSDEALHYSEDRMLLLDTVRQKIDSELNRREQKHTSKKHHPPRKKK